MLSDIEKTLLKEFLALIPYPEQSLSYNELMGYLYGLAITPTHIPEQEWMSAIFSDDVDSVPAEAQARGMYQILAQVYSAFLSEKRMKKLHFPYEIETLAENELEEVLEWVSGFEEALALRPETWEPESDAKVSPKKKEELFFSLMVIQGLTDPAEIMPFFEKLPKEVFSETFLSYDPNGDDRELQVQAFLLATLPLAVQTLQDYGASLESSDRELLDLSFPLQPGERQWSSPPAYDKNDPPKKKKGEVIQVDFTRKEKL